MVFTLNFPDRMEKRLGIQSQALKKTFLLKTTHHHCSPSPPPQKKKGWVINAVKTKNTPSEHKTHEL